MSNSGMDFGMKFQRVSTGRSTSWLKEGEWWRKRDWGFKLQFSGQGTQSILYDNEVDLKDVVQYVLHVKETVHLGLGIGILFNAFESSKPSLVESISVHVNDAEFESLARAIDSGCLLQLRSVRLQNSDIGNGQYTLSKSIRWVASGRLPSLKTLVLQDIRMMLQFEAYGMELSPGKLPNLLCLYIRIIRDDFKSLSLTIRSDTLDNSAELSLEKYGITDEGLIALADSFQEGWVRMWSTLRCNSFTEGGMLLFAEALGSGKLPKLRCLDISGNNIGDNGARSIGLALQSGKLENLDELDLSSNHITDEGLSALGQFFYLTKATILPIIRLSNNSFTEQGALRLVDAIYNNTSYTVGSPVEFEWDKFPEVNSLRLKCIERNSWARDIEAGLRTELKVQATFGKVYICGNPEVGKTTLRYTLQRRYLESFWQSPHVENRTRGIDVSQLSSKGNEPVENPITLHVWDMAGQEEYHLVHNAFFPDLGLAEGRATTFIVVCSSKSPHNSEELDYWLRYISSSCGKNIQHPRPVFVVMNNIGEGQQIHKRAQNWKRMLEYKRKKFEKCLDIQTDLFLVDVMEFQQVQGLKRRLLKLSRDLLRNKKVPDICQAIQKNLTVLCQGREQFPVFHWTEFVERVHRLQDPWTETTIEAATKYLNEAGVIIYIHSEGVRLVIVDSSWFCSEIIGRVFLPPDMARSTDDLFREKVDQNTGSISISSFKEYFKSLESEWSDAEADDLIAILLWLGLCYRGKDTNIFLPALIAEQGTPGHPWCIHTEGEHVGDQWVMGFSVKHQESEVALAPISLWHRFQVDLAQTVKFDSEVPDNDFVAGKYFMTFIKDYMNVLIEVDANLSKPTFDEINILVKPGVQREELAANERKQHQLDLASDLVERLLKLWKKVCPGVGYVQKVIWPWPVSRPRPKEKPERNVEVGEVKKWVEERGVGRKMQWVVGSGDPITEDQLLSTKDKTNLGLFTSSRTSGIKEQARQVNDSLFELYRPPKSTPKTQILFFHGLQMEDYSDAHLSTWQSRDGSTIWPRTWLVDEVPGAHVLSVSYNVGLRKYLDGSVDMYTIGENLLSDLLHEGVGHEGVGQVPHCPVVLVGHSIGGVVIKNLCLWAHNKFNRSSGYERARLEKFLKNIGGIFYYSTPHQGSDVAEILAKKISSPLLTYFQTLSKDSARLNYEFEAMCKVNYKHWLFAGLGETLPTNLGPLKAGVASTEHFVVPEASARGENFNVVEESDHFTVCRPRTKRMRGFTKLRDFVSRIASKGSDAEKIYPANRLLRSASI